MNLRTAECFQYGFLSSRTSGALVAYLHRREHRSRQSLTAGDREAIIQAVAFLRQVRSGKTVMIGSDEQTPTREEMEAFWFFWRVVSPKFDQYGVNEDQDIDRLINHLLQPLESISAGRHPRRRNVVAVRTFFYNLSQQMLAEVSAPRHSGCCF